jgi:hypothetical protein
MPIEPDDKDWTWVLERPCPECGFESAAVRREDLGPLIRRNATQWPAVLERPGVAERTRDDRWSDLEYACHVRDVFRLYDRRLHLMLEDDGAEFPNWDQDATAVEDAYAEQDPATVATELLEAAEVLAASFDAVEDDQWDRRGRRSDGAEFTVDTFGRYFIHDPVHHLWDVGVA